MNTLQLFEINFIHFINRIWKTNSNRELKKTVFSSNKKYTKRTT